MTQPAPNSNYTAAEINAVVTQLVLSTISYPTDTLGVRRTDVTFDDIQQAAAGIFILYPNSPFYVLQLGMSRVQDQITAEAAIFVSLLAAVSSMGLSVIPVNDVSPLFNVQAALQNLGTAAASSTGVSSNVMTTPSYQQYTTNLNSFLSGPGQNVKQNGAIQQTPQQAQASIPTLMTQLQQAHTTLVATVTSLVNGITDYNSVNLSNMVIQSVLANAASLVGSDANALNSLTPTERLASIRSVVLHLLATDAVINTFGVSQGPSDFYTLSGLGTAYSDVNNLAMPAVVNSDIPTSYSIIAGVNDDLNVTADGGTPFDILLNPSTIGEIDGSISDPFNISSSNDTLLVEVGSTTYSASLTHGSAQTADQVAADINAALPSGVEAEGFYYPLQFSGQLNIPAGTNTTWTLQVPGSSNLVALGVTTGSTVQVQSGANVGTYPITAVTASSLTVTGTTSLQAGASVEIGPVNRRVKILFTDPAVQVPEEATVTVTSTNTVTNSTLTTLGFSSGQFGQCLMTTPDQVATDINSKTGNITASATVVDFASVTTAHADTTNPNLIVFSEAAAGGNGVFTGAELVFTVGSITLQGNISSGDTVAVRTGSAVATYSIETINGDVELDHALTVGDAIEAFGVVDGTSGALTVEFGPGFQPSEYQVVTIPSGPNNGTYIVTGPGDTYLDVLVQQVLPVQNSPTSPTTNPISFTASIGLRYLTLASKNTTTASELVLQGDAASTFFTSPPKTQVGTSPYFLLPSIPNGLQAGDILEYYVSNFEVPDFSYTIVQVLTSLNVIQVSPDPVAGTYPPDNASWQFSTQPVPFAKLHYGVSNNFSQVQTALQTWLNLPENQPLYFTNMNALINPLLVNSSPTAEQVGAATTAINQIYQFLTTAQATALLGNGALALQSILTTFTVEPVSSIDALIQTYTASGADLAIDTLLQGMFSAFFGMSDETSSYSGAFQAATRSVAQNDLPIRKTNRSTAQSSQLQGQTASPDYEYPANGVTESIPGPQVNPPADAGTPSNYGTTTGSSGYGSNGA